MTHLAGLSGETFVALLEEAPDAMVCIAADGRIVLVNAQAERRALAEVEQRARLANLEDQLLQAQRLASLGQLEAAEQAMSRIRQLLTAARGDARVTEPTILRASSREPRRGDT